MGSRRNKTAAELLSELESDPEWVAAHEARERSHAARVAEHERLMRPVLAALAEAGLAVGSLDELTASGGHADAVPVLRECLTQATDAAVKEHIVRTLSVPGARPSAARPLVAEFETAGDSPRGLRWAIGNALEVVSDESVVDDLLRLVEDDRYGRDRQMVVLALGRVGDERVVPSLIRLLDDDELVGHAAMALAKLRASDARPALERLVDHPRPWVRKEVHKALSKLPTP